MAINNQYQYSTNENNTAASSQTSYSTPTGQYSPEANTFDAQQGGSTTESSSPVSFEPSSDNAYNSGGYDASKSTYDPTTISASAYSGYDANLQRSVANEQTVAWQVNALTSQNNPYMQQARTAGLQQAAQRGLLNSSMAIGAAQDAAIRYAMPIAQQDAARYGEVANLDQQYSNQSMQYNAGLKYEAARQNAAALNQAAQFNASTGLDRWKQNDAQEFDRWKQLEGQAFQQSMANQGYGFEAQQAEAQRSWQSGETALDRQQATQLNSSQLTASMAELQASLANATGINRDNIQASMQELQAEIGSRERLQDDAQNFSQWELDKKQSFERQILSDSQAFQQWMQNDMQGFEKWSQNDKQRFEIKLMNNQYGHEQKAAYENFNYQRALQDDANNFSRWAQDDQQAFLAAMQTDDQAFQKWMQQDMRGFEEWAQDDQQAFLAAMQNDQQSWLEIQSALERQAEAAGATTQLEYQTLWNEMSDATNRYNTDTNAATQLTGYDATTMNNALNQITQFLSAGIDGGGSATQSAALLAEIMSAMGIDQSFMDRISGA